MRAIATQSVAEIDRAKKHACSAHRTPALCVTVTPIPGYGRCDAPAQASLRLGDCPHCQAEEPLQAKLQVS